MRTKCAACRPRSRTNRRPASTRDKLLDGGRAKIRLRSDDIIRKTVGGGARRPPFGRLEGQASTELGTQFVHRLRMFRPSRSARVARSEDCYGSMRGEERRRLECLFVFLRGGQQRRSAFSFVPSTAKSTSAPNAPAPHFLLLPESIARATTSQPSRL
jgi:hypothetical protein